MPFGEFAVALEQIQAYLRGEAVSLDGFASRLMWLAPDCPRCR